MMRSDARTILRRWLLETTADTWQDADLNQYLLLAVREVQKIVVALDPDGIKKTYRANLTIPVTGRDAIYSYPAGTWGVIELATSDDGVSYTPMTRATLQQARNGDYANTVFVPWGPRHFAIFPAPSVPVVDGLRAIVVPTLTMAVDTDELPNPPAFDALTIKHAERFALKDSGEPTDKLDAEIALEEQKAPRFHLSSTVPTYITPVVSRYS